MFDLAAGETIIGPVYNGVDLTVTGMKMSDDPALKEFAFGGAANIVGIGGEIWKSKIEMHGE